VAGGLLSGGLAVLPGSPLTIQLPGTINSLEALATAIAKAITPPKVTAPATAALQSSTLAAPAALPAAASKAVTLSTAPTVKVAAPAGDTAAPHQGRHRREHCRQDGRHQFRHRSVRRHLGENRHADLRSEASGADRQRGQLDRGGVTRPGDERIDRHPLNGYEGRQARQEVAARQLSPLHLGGGSTVASSIAAGGS